MNTHKITTPKGSQEIEIKSWITGREAEHIDELTYESMAVKADFAGNPEMGNIDLKKIISEGNHRLIQTFVVSIDGVKDDILNKVLDMHEEDTKFILNHIEEHRKKK